MRKLERFAYVIGALVSAIYILNPTAGVFELLPDNLPGIGNLDEALMVTILLGCLRSLRRLREQSALGASGSTASAPTPHLAG